MTAEEIRAMAPLCTSFASELREIFGEARIERIAEGELNLGKPDENIYATCLYRGDGLPMLEGR